MRRLYLDHNATTPLDPRVRATMSSWLGRAGPANPSSLHAEGRAARRVVEDARDAIADALGTTPDRLIFTSGATEANALALEGLRLDDADVPERIAVSAVEHPSILEPARSRARTTVLGVDAFGILRLDDLDRTLASGGRPLIAVMAANNEVGSLQPVEAVAARCRAAGSPFHCDAVQWFGKCGVRVADIGASSVALSAHKIGGPTGIGLLWLAPDARVVPLIRGGGQERERRAGTENVLGILGFGSACALAAAEWQDRARRLAAAESEFLATLKIRIPEVHRHGPTSASQRLPGTLNLRLPSGSSEALVHALDLAGVAASLGSACSSGAARPSPVLAAMGATKVENSRSLRFSLGYDTTLAEVREAAERIAEVFLRNPAPVTDL